MGLEALFRSFLHTLPDWAALVILGTVVAYGQWRRHTEARETTKSDRIQKFIDKLPTIRGPNKALLSEQLFLDLFGKHLSYPEIQFFLKTNCPTEYIRYFLNGRAYFERFRDCPQLKPAFDSERRLTLAKWHRIFWYGIFSSAALTLVFNLPTIFRSPPQVWIVVVYLIFSSLLLAYQFLDASVNIDAANNLRKQLNLEPTSQATH